MQSFACAQHVLVQLIDLGILHKKVAPVSTSYEGHILRPLALFHCMYKRLMLSRYGRSWQRPLRHLGITCIRQIDAPAWRDRANVLAGMHHFDPALILRKLAKQLFEPSAFAFLAIDMLQRSRPYAELLAVVCKGHDVRFAVARCLAQ